jgi:hypothetical protein
VAVGGRLAVSSCNTACTAFCFAGEANAPVCGTSAGTDTPMTEDVGKAPVPLFALVRNMSAHDFFTGGAFGGAGFVGAGEGVSAACSVGAESMISVAGVVEVV